jgi:hypothetical protein
LSYFPLLSKIYASNLPNLSFLPFPSYSPYFVLASRPTAQVHSRTDLLPPQDIIFGSQGTAQADFERMEEINEEIGLNTILHGAPEGTGAADMKDRLEPGRKDVFEKEYLVE